MVWPHFAAAQVCKDEESMVDESKKSLAEIGHHRQAGERFEF